MFGGNIHGATNRQLNDAAYLAFGRIYKVALGNRESLTAV